MQLDAIVVPARVTDSANKLDEAARLAQQLGRPLIALHTGGFPEDIDQMGRRYPNLVALQLSENYDHELLQFRVEDVLRRLFAGQMPPGPLDVSRKRNIGLLLGRLCGWKRILYLDDDLLGLRPEQIVAAVAAVDQYPVVGFKVGGFYDNSVVYHGFRHAGAEPGTVPGSTMVIDPSKETSYFWPGYNEDWSFFLRYAAAGRMAVVGGPSQLRYDPFANTGRARAEEFCDILAEGLFDLLVNQKKTLDQADEAYWSKVLADRRNLIDAIKARLSTRPGSASRAGLEALEEAGRHEFTPADFVRVCQAWQADGIAWPQRLNSLPEGLSFTQAVEFLGLRAYPSPAETVEFLGGGLSDGSDVTDNATKSIEDAGG